MALWRSCHERSAFAFALFRSLKLTPVQFCAINGLDCIARAHQLVQEGYKYQFSHMLVTVWSAPNYCYRCGNVASVMKVDEKMRATWTIFDSVADSERRKPHKTTMPYFL
jgi:hypothetical protein